MPKPPPTPLMMESKRKHIQHRVFADLRESGQGPGFSSGLIGELRHGAESHFHKDNSAFEVPASDPTSRLMSRRYPQSTSIPRQARTLSGTTRCWHGRLVRQSNSHFCGSLTPGSCTFEVPSQQPTTDPTLRGSHLLSLSLFPSRLPGHIRFGPFERPCSASAAAAATKAWTTLCSTIKPQNSSSM
jgi:hypothetical protein